MASPVRVRCLPGAGPSARSDTCTRLSVTCALYLRHRSPMRRFEGVTVRNALVRVFRHGSLSIVARNARRESRRASGKARIVRVPASGNGPTALENGRTSPAISQIIAIIGGVMTGGAAITRPGPSLAAWRLAPPSLPCHRVTRPWWSTAHPITTRMAPITSPCRLADIRSLPRPPARSSSTRPRRP